MRSLKIKSVHLSPKISSANEIGQLERLVCLIKIYYTHFTCKMKVKDSLFTCKRQVMEGSMKKIVLATLAYVVVIPFPENNRALLLRLRGIPIQLQASASHVYFLEMVLQC